MKLNLILTIGCMSLFAVSCAHKPVESKDNTAKLTTELPPVKQEVKTENKVAEANKGDISLNCVLGDDSRVITLQKGDKRCEVHYTKSGTLNNIAWGEQTPSICDKVFDNVRGNIEKGGFKCSDEGQKTASNRD
jgi:hypothetical protein